MMKRKIFSLFLALLIFISGFSAFSVYAKEKDVYSTKSSKATVNGFDINVGDKITVDFYVFTSENWKDFCGEIIFDSIGLQFLDFQMPNLGVSGRNGLENIIGDGYIYYSGNKERGYIIYDLFCTVSFKVLKAGNYEINNYFSKVKSVDDVMLVEDNVIKDESLFETGYLISIDTPKKSQTITAKSYTKVYGSKAFNLGAKAKTKLSYSSNNKGVATVSSKGNISIKGVGKATITIKAQETSTYKSSTKKITIKVNPNPVPKITYSVVSNGVVKLKWDKVPKALFYEIVVLYNKNKISRDVWGNSIIIKGLKKNALVKIRAVTNTNDGDFFSSYKTLNVSPFIKVNPVNEKSIKYQKKGSNLYVSWSKVSGAKGYQVKVYAANKNGSYSGSKFVNKNALTLKNVSKGQKVKFSIRTCKLVNKKSQYSAWKTKTFIVK